MLQNSSIVDQRRNRPQFGIDALKQALNVVFPAYIGCNGTRRPSCLRSLTASGEERTTADSVWCLGTGNIEYAASQSE